MKTSMHTLVAAVLALLAGDASAQVLSRTDDTTYHDNTAAWVLGQVAQSTNLDTGLVESQTTYDAAALPVETRAFGAVQSVITWWWVGVPRTSTDANGNVTTFSHYHRGIPQRVVLADGQMRSAVVDASGLITSTTDEIGATTCYAFDTMGRLATTIYPSETASQTCDESAWRATRSAFVSVPHAEYGIPAGHWRRTTRTGAGVEHTFYDAFWRPLVALAFDETSAAETASFAITRYDAGGNAAFRSYPLRTLGNYFAQVPGTRTTHDALDRPIRVEQDSELGVLATTTDYLPGLQVRTTNARGYSTTTAYLAYDQPAFDHPLWIVEPEDTITEIARDVFGKPTALKRRNSASTIALERRYTYDAHQRLCKSIEPETGSSVYAYDAAGNLVSSASGLSLPDGTPCESDRASARASTHHVRRDYNSRNLPTALSFTDGRGDQSLAYTQDGLLASATTWNDGAPVRNTYAYNQRRLLVEEGSDDWRLQYGYDANGHLATQRFPDNASTLHYALDALGRTTAVSDHAGNRYATQVQYHPNNAIAYFKYGNQVEHALLQNVRQLPSRVFDGHVSDLAYTYDANGNPASIRAPGAIDGLHSGNRDLVYDGRDRLASAHLHWWKIHRFGHDALDNIASHAVFDGNAWTTKAYAYDTSNRLTNLVDATSGASVTGLGYDARGNLRNKNGQAYDFDHGNRLRAVVGKEAYRYDVHGRRVLARSAAGDIVSMYAASGQLAYQDNRRSGIRTYYVYLAGSLIATREASASGVVGKFHHTDALGSPIAVTDAAGSVIDRTFWEPYGGAIDKPAYQGVGYAGHVVDGASGLVYMQQRFYDPSVGRFLSIDPVVADAGNGWNFNRYNYAANNPYKFKDPDGRVIETVWDVANVAMGAASLGSNLATGNYGAAAVDAGGLLVDAAATFIPGVPGGAGAAIKAARLADNARQGAKAEASVAQDLGGKVAGQRVTLEATTGQRSVTDLVTTDREVLEVKSGNAQLSSGQKAVQADVDAGRPVIPRGANAAKAGLTPNQPTPMKCYEVKRCK